MNIKDEVLKEKQTTINLRRELHKIPEPGFEEFKTSGFISEKLTGYGLDVKTGAAKTGVIGNLISKQFNNKSGNKRKTIMLRADIDALPIQEKSNIDYISTHKGYMHACGHDGHIAIALTAAKILSSHKNELKGNVKFVFQPAEEYQGGAKPMIEEGVLHNPEVNSAIGLHIWNSIPSGKVGIRKGPLMASVDNFKIKIIGKSSHGAMPHEGVDSIVIASYIINSIQTIITREINPVTPCVITIGKISGGSASNIIAEEVYLEGTARTLNQDLNSIIFQKMEKIIKGITECMNAKYEFDYDFLYPVTVNNDEMTQVVYEAACEAVGAENIIEPEQSMGGDDMAYYLQKIPGCYFFLGSSNKEKGIDFPLHSNNFNFDEGCLPIGVEIIIRTILKSLK